MAVRVPCVASGSPLLVEYPVDKGCLALVALVTLHVDVGLHIAALRPVPVVDIVVLPDVVGVRDGLQQVLQLRDKAPVAGDCLRHHLEVDVEVRGGVLAVGLERYARFVAPVHKAEGALLGEAVVLPVVDVLHRHLHRVVARLLVLVAHGEQYGVAVLGVEFPVIFRLPAQVVLHRDDDVPHQHQVDGRLPLGGPVPESEPEYARVST